MYDPKTNRTRPIWRTVAMRILHNHLSPPFYRDPLYTEPLTLSEAVKTYFAILFGVGICMVAFYYLSPIS
jgi:hypothetical protein